LADEQAHLLEHALAVLAHAQPLDALERLLAGGRAGARAQLGPAAEEERRQGLDVDAGLGRRRRVAGARRALREGGTVGRGGHEVSLGPEGAARCSGRSRSGRAASRRAPVGARRSSGVRTAGLWERTPTGPAHSQAATRSVSCSRSGTSGRSRWASHHSPAPRTKPTAPAAHAAASAAETSVTRANGSATSSITESRNAARGARFAAAPFVAGPLAASWAAGSSVPATALVRVTK